MRKSVLFGVLVSSAVLLIQRRRRNNQQYARHASSSPSRDLVEKGRDIADLTTRRYIMYVVFPAWCVPGMLDWYWHRRTKIETTSGVPESITHLLMMTEAGVPILLGLFLEINAGVLAFMFGGALVHELTVMWDISYTSTRRKIPPAEQHTHSFMEAIPFNVVAILACLHPEQFLALLRMGPEKPRYDLRLKTPPLPARHIAFILAAATLLVGLPHVEELWRCWRAQQRGLTGRDTPECARELYAA